MTQKIALVEDDEQLRSNYVAALEREGYEVESFSDRFSALSSFALRLPDLAILDVMLADDIEGGFEICRELRRRSAVLPIIFLTARNSDVDRVSGLRLGAWDYLTKDTTTLGFLPARVTALFRVIDALREPPPSVEERWQRGSLVLDQNLMQVFWKAEVITLTLTEFWILRALVEYPGHVRSHGQLMEAAQVAVHDNTIASHIGRIRRGFKESDPDFACIRTEYGMGYRWVED